MKKKIEKWFYELKHGHEFLLEEEVDIILDTRFDSKTSWMSERQIQHFVKSRIKIMYKEKFPHAKTWRITTLSR
jgi:hypothetical protein